MKTFVGKLLAVLATALLVSCGGDARPEPTLVPAGDQEAVRRTSMQALRVQDTTSGEWFTETSSLLSGGTGFMYALSDLCAGIGVTTNGLSPTNCADAERVVVGQLCYADIYRDLAKDDGANRHVGRFLVPVQSTATRVALLRESSRIAFTAARNAAEALAGTACGDAAKLTKPATRLANSPPLVGDTRGEVLARAVSEGFALAKNSLKELRTVVLSVSDAEASSTPSSSLADWRSWVAPEFSRTAAAQTMVGGPWEITKGKLFGHEGGFCSAGLLSAPAARALDLLRMSGGPVPAIYDEDVTLDVLLYGSSSVPDSVSARLSAILKNPDLASTSDLPSALGLTAADFTAARRKIIEERFAYGRVQYESQRLMATDGTETPYMGSLSVRLPPEDAPDVYYAALARNGEDLYIGDGTAFYDRSTAPNSLEGVLEAERIVLRKLPTSVTGGWRTAAYGTVGELMANLVDSAVNAHRAESPLSIWVRGEGYNTFAVNVIGQPEQLDELRWGRGLNHLRCAMTGFSEGQKCWGGSIGQLQYLGTQGCSSTNLWLGPGEVVRCFSIYAPEGGRRYSPEDMPFLVKASQPGASNWGEFEPVAAIGERATYRFGVSSEAQSLAADAIRPSKISCKSPDLSCAGGEFDARMPFENELAEDGDGKESSWRHYLNLAKEAASHSDSLGSEFVSAALNTERRYEEIDLRNIEREREVANALETLQSTCGTNLDPLRLMDSLTVSDGEDCYSDDNCAAGTEFCAAGKCVSLPATDGSLESEELDRLKACLGTGDEVVPFANLGTDQIFIGKDDYKAYHLAPADPAKSGPALSSQSPVCIEPDGSGAWRTCAGGSGQSLMAFPTRPLQLVSGIGDDSGSNLGPVCSAFRRLREGQWQGNASGFADDLNLVRNSGVFDHEAVLALMSRVQFRAAVDTYATVFLDGKPVWTFGTVDGGPNLSSWPCASQPPAAGVACPANAASLMCKTSYCANDYNRAPAIQRLLRAVLGAKVVSGAKTEVVVPLQLHEPVEFLAPPAEFHAAPGPLASSAGGEYRFKVGQFKFKFEKEFDGDHEMTVNQVTWDGAESGALWRTVGPPSTVVPVASSGGQASVFGPFVRTLGPRDWTCGLRKVLFDGLSNSVTAKGDNWPEKYFDFALRRLYSLNGRPFPLSEPDGGWEQGCVGEAGFPWFYDSDAAVYLYGEGNERVEAASPVLAGFCFSQDVLLDSAEMLCELSRFDQAVANGTSVANPDQLPEITDASDLPAVAGFARSVARRIVDWAKEITVARVPVSAFDAQNRQTNGAFPGVGGEYGTEVAGMREELVSLSTLVPSIGTELRNLAGDLSSLSTALKRADLAGKINELQMQRESVAAAEKCVLSTVSAGNAATFGAQGIAACSLAFAELNIAGEISEAQSKDVALQSDEALNEFARRFDGRLATLRSLASETAVAAERLDGHAAKLEALRLGARRKLAEAIRAQNAIPKNQEDITRATEWQREMARRRYEEAFAAAKKLAFLAARAIEDRIGRKLMDMGDDLPLVEAPQSWAGTLCTRSGIDWEAIKAKGSSAGDQADPFIGDYVAKLELVVESYRLANGFQDGDDEVIISLRDDVFGVRRVCEVPSPNLLLWSSDMDHLAADGEAGWHIYGCPDGVSCVGLRRLMPGIDEGVSAGAPFQPGGDVNSNAAAFRVEFGDVVAGVSACSGANPSAECAPQGVAQKLALGAGSYRLSYYGNQTAVGLWDVAEGAFVAPVNGKALGGDANTWTRQWFYYDLSSAGEFEVRVFGRPGQVPVDLAGMMLERVDSAVVAAGGRPLPYDCNYENATSMLPVCEDLDGIEFQKRAWTKECAVLCPNGFSGGCEPTADNTHCYWKIPFSINQRDIESGRLMANSGFAYGNFNYRIDQIGVNFVGTGVKNCTDSNTPSTCYSAGFVPYSLEHQGPFTITNYEGAEYDMQIFPGRIESAKGLAAERYLTNPMSSADQGLMAEYMRTEWQGRPLDGNYILKVWDTPGLDISAIDDVQFVIKYGYWTRQN